MSAFPTTHHVTLLFFAAFREAIGLRRLEVDVEEGTTVDTLFCLLQNRYPAIERLRRCTTFAVNREIVPASTILRPGDEIAFLQPVSGG